MKMILAIVVLVVASCCNTSVASTENDDSVICKSLLRSGLRLSRDKRTVILPDIDESKSSAADFEAFRESINLSIGKDPDLDIDILGQEALEDSIRQSQSHSKDPDPDILPSLVYANSIFGNSFQDSCTMNCIKNNKDRKSEKHFYRQIYNTRVKINEFFNQTSLQHSCPVLTRIMNCIGRCDNQQSVSFYNRLLEPVKYMCTDSRFLDYVPCYRQVYDETWVTCNAPETCRHKQKTMNQIMKQNITVLASMTQFCDLLNCYQDCQHTKMIQICGEEKNKVLNKFYRIGLAMIKDQMFEETSATWPFQCSRVGIDTD